MKLSIKSGKPIDAIFRKQQDQYNLLLLTTINYKILRSPTIKFFETGCQNICLIKSSKHSKKTPRKCLGCFAKPKFIITFL